VQVADEVDESPAGEPEEGDVSGRPDQAAAPARPDLLDQGIPRQPGLAEVKLSALRRKFSMRLRKIQTALYDDAVDRRWFAGRPDRIRTRWHSIGFLVLAAGIGLIWVAAAKTHLGLVAIPFALAGLALAWTARGIPRRTPTG